MPDRIGGLASASRAGTGRRHQDSLLPDLRGRSAWVPLGRRKDAVRYPFPVAVRYETRLIGFAEEIAPGEGQDLKGSGWSVRSSFKRDGNALEARWEMNRQATRFEPGAFPDLRSSGPRWI